MFGRSGLTTREIVGRVDQAEMAERLREVAKLPPGDGVVFLGEQAHVVREAEQPLEQPLALRPCRPMRT